MFVGRHDARRAVCGSLGDLFDVERNPVTILSHHFAELGEQCVLSSANICFFWNRRSLGSAASVLFRDAEWFLVLVSQHLVNLVSRQSTSLGGSVSSVLSVPKSAGIVDGVETSFKDEMMLDQQLMTAFHAGLRHSLNDPDHDAMSDL